MTHVQTSTPAAGPACDPSADPASPNDVPFYARPEHAPEWEAFRSFLERFGTPLICPRAACARAGRCGDESRRRLPFCFDHYRGLLRFVVMAAQAAGRSIGSGPAADGRSFLGELAAGGLAAGGLAAGRLAAGRLAAGRLDLEALRRPLEAGEDRSCFETDESGREAFERLVAAMGGRPSGGFAQRARPARRGRGAQRPPNTRRHRGEKPIR